MHCNNRQKGEQLMHKSLAVLGCMAIALILALLIPLIGCGGGGPAVPCKISSVSGTVQVLKNGSTNPENASNGMELAVGDTITTGSNGSATLTFFDGSVMEIKANSEILVNELTTLSTGSTVVSLKEQVGNTINRIGKLVDSSSKYEVDTPAAVAVVRGTVFDLLVLQNGTTTVKAEQDSVSFSASGVTVTVNQGFQSSAVVGGKPSTPLAITTVTPTATATSTSGQTLADVYGKGYKGDVKYDVFLTAGGMSQQLLYKTYYKGWNSTNTKVRYETPAAYPGGFTQVTIWDSSTRTNYLWYPDQHVACQVPTGQGQDNTQGNATQIVPTYLGTDTVDSKLCDVYQWTFGNSTMKELIWKEKSFPIKQEFTTSGQTSTMEFQNIVFGPLSNDLFTVPSKEIQPYPCYPMPTYAYPFPT
jgi:hypothetical protein